MNNAYDALAPHYRDYSRRKSAYLEAVDRLIMDNLPTSRNALLDVGAGDGVRSVSLARRMQAKRVVLAEPSKEMAKLCRATSADEVWQCTAQQLPETNERFDVILCLWNVLGHVPTPDERARALLRIGGLLAPGGRLFIDVNNRHNATAYGGRRVAFRRLIDAALPNPARGDASFDWKIGDAIFQSMGHLFTPAEISNLLQSCPLKAVKRVTLNYVSGAVTESPFEGQLAFIVEK